MTLKVFGSVFVCSALAVACSGGGGIGNSGVDTDIDIVDVTPDEAADLCEYLIGLAEQPEREVDCGNGQVVTIGINPEDVDDAIANCITDLAMIDESCMATVGDFEACFEASSNASDELICSPDLPPSCVHVAPCI